MQSLESTRRYNQDYFSSLDSLLILEIIEDDGDISINLRRPSTFDSEVFGRGMLGRPFNLIVERDRRRGESN